MPKSTCMKIIHIWSAPDRKYTKFVLKQSKNYMRILGIFGWNVMFVVFRRNFIVWPIFCTTTKDKTLQNSVSVCFYIFEKILCVCYSIINVKMSTGVSRKVVTPWVWIYSNFQRKYYFENIFKGGGQTFHK